MDLWTTRTALLFLAAFASIFLTACGGGAEPDTDTVTNTSEENTVSAFEPRVADEPEAPEFPDLQAEIVDDRFRGTISPLGRFDFLNHTFPLPRGWQNPDGSDITLIDGKLEAISGTVDETASDEERSRQRAERRIGMSHVVTKYFDATGDGEDEAIVILKIETAGNAIPQVIYIFTWKDDRPELLWHFRTGDRTDGGLKDIRPDAGELVIELYGQDRYMLGEIETGKITGDDAQLCCPTHYTRSNYKWNGRHFIRRGDRLTFALDDESAPPVKNMGDVVNSDPRKK